MSGKSGARRPGFPSCVRLAAILAGGDGTRLRGFTRLMFNDDRPKQFCRLVNGRSLLATTRARLAPVVAPERTLYVLSVRHETFYRVELADVGRRQLIEQPCNRGTTTAIALAVAEASGLAEDGVLGCFPADHHYENDQAFRGAIEAGYAAACVHRDRVLLVGADATSAETDYGWIEAGRPLSGLAPGSPVVRSVLGFVEKPSAVEAEALLARRCLWNTFVLIGHLHALRALVAAADPNLYEQARGVAGLAGPDRVRAMETMYAATRDSDFSRDVLAVHAARLGVMSLGASGWTDLGQSARLLEVLGRVTTPARHTRAAG